jgi:hypothetical protein
MKHFWVATLWGWCVCVVMAGALAAPVLAQVPQPAPVVSGTWRLVFGTDTAGRPSSGEKADLLRAVRAGQPIRVGWQILWRLPDGAAGILEHTASASFLTIHHGEVFAQLAPILGQTPSAREPAVRLRTDRPLLWYGLLDTRGWLAGYFMGGDTVPPIRVATFWYAQ